MLGPVKSYGNNLVAEIDDTSSGWLSSDRTGTTAQPLKTLLGVLGNYGGPTQTIPLLPGSPAIGAGVKAAYPNTTTPITNDQRGQLLDSPTPDIGAFQSNPLVVNTTIDSPSSPFGDLSLRQAVNLANALNNAQTITFDTTVFATAQTITLSQGTLVLNDTGGDRDDHRADGGVDHQRQPRQPGARGDTAT